MATTRNSSARANPADTLTPAMRQYVEQKASAPDALLLFRMGDFYETFYDDAETAARVLGIALTSRGQDRDGRNIPLAGIPHHALESYLTRLVQAGFKVAISEQVEDPRQAKGVVRREIVRIVTPGTLTDDALLEQRSDNYLACLCHRREGVGVAFVELSTGAFHVQTLPPAELLDELVKLRPAELLLPELAIDARDPLEPILKELTGDNPLIPDLLVSRRSAHLFDTYQAEQRLCRHFRVATLEGFGFEKMDAGLCAAAVIVDYLSDTQRGALQHITRITPRNPRDFVLIDQSTWRSLEIERTIRSGAASGTLLHAVDRTATPMGARCLRRWLASPLCHIDAIRRRQDATADLLADVHRLDDILDALGHLADIERITARLGVGRASPRDLVALGRTLVALEAIADQFDALAQNGGLAGAGLCPFLDERCRVLRAEHALAEFLSASLEPDPPLATTEGGIIAPGFDEELDNLRSIGSDGRQWLAEFQAREIERSGIPSLKVGYNQVFGYYIEITHTHASRVPADYVRKQTLKNAERYITDELKQYETRVLTARDRANTREAELFDTIRQQAIERITSLLEIATAVSEIDVVAGFAHLADQRRYTRPELVDEPVLHIRDGRHPVLEQTLDEKFVPNDCFLGPPPERDGELPESAPTRLETLILLTGPNMAGKSTYIRQVALLTLLAQTGSYVPAARMRFGPVDRIFARVGASDELTRGQSTFMVEMTEAANILNNATDRSLVIIDELGRGTSTFDGLALAWAIAEDLVRRIRCRTLFATHYHELTDLERYLTGVANCNVAVREWQDEVVFLHRIVRGGADKSYGVHVARLAGVGRDVIARSQELLSELQSTIAAPRRTPARAARHTREDPQLYLFADPADEIITDLRATAPETLTPLDALRKLAEWKKRLDT
jgi:DNA mismatch repair protein MutS